MNESIRLVIKFYYKYIFIYFLTLELGIIERVSWKSLVDAAVHITHIQLNLLSLLFIPIFLAYYKSTLSLLKCLFKIR